MREGQPYRRVLRSSTQRGPRQLLRVDAELPAHRARQADVPGQADECAADEQRAKANGAQVTGVDGPGKLEAMRRVGADDVVDFTREDFTRSGQHYDLILDVVGRRSLGDYRRALRPGGVCGVIGGSTGRLVSAAVLGQTLRLSAGRRVSLVVYRANKADDVALLVRLIDEGAVVPVIDRVFPLSEGPQAMRHYLGGGFAGKIVITM